MGWPDIVNALFEGGMSFVLLRSVLQLHRDKKVAGLHWTLIAFTTAWGVWNLYYYPHLGQWWSFYAGAAVVSINAWYVTAIRYYMRRPGGRNANREHALCCDEMHGHTPPKCCRPGCWCLRSRWVVAREHLSGGIGRSDP